MPPSEVFTNFFFFYVYKVISGIKDLHGIHTASQGNFFAVQYRIVNFFSHLFVPNVPVEA